VRLAQSLATSSSFGGLGSGFFGGVGASLHFRLSGGFGSFLLDDLGVFLFRLFVFLGGALATGGGVTGRAADRRWRGRLSSACSDGQSLEGRGGVERRGLASGVGGVGWLSFSAVCDFNLLFCSLPASRPYDLAELGIRMVSTGTASWRRRISIMRKN